MREGDADDNDDEVVETLKEVADAGSQSLRNLQRIIARGQGPPIVHLSPRRRGVIRRDRKNYYRSLRRFPPGQSEEQR
jgi:hypothetical protein